MAYRTTSSGRRACIGGALACAFGACNGEDIGRSEAALVTVECAEADELPDSAWICNQPRTLECGADATLFVVDDETTSCADEELVLSNAGPFAPGTHTLIVSDQTGEPLCASNLTVFDTLPPVLRPHTIALWPPNHSMHAIGVEDCVSVEDACDAEWQGEFMWASSDEPGDALGDGNHAPDISLSTDGSRVCMRSERQGPEDGRVYKLGVRVIDAGGNEALGECTVMVNHDQSGALAQDSGEAYRVTFDGSEAPPSCDDVTAQP